jgi:hypothetical protein
MANWRVKCACACRMLLGAHGALVRAHAQRDRHVPPACVLIFIPEPVVCSLVNRLTKEANAKVPRIVVSCRRGQINSYELAAGPEGIGTRVCAGACAAGGRV